MGKVILFLCNYNEFQNDERWCYHGCHVSTLKLASRWHQTLTNALAIA